MIEIKNINVYAKDKKILDDISFVIPKGKITAFVGNNGAGKTTTIRTILNQIKIESGEILFNNSNIFDNNNLLNLMFFPDLNNIILNISGKEYFEYYKILFGIKIENKNVELILKSMKVEDLWNKKIQKLSSGEKKKILIAIVILLKRDCLILDEPTANLDVTSKELLLEILLKLRQNNITILITSHIIEELQMIADHLILIDNGKILYNNSFDNKKESIKDIFGNKVKVQKNDDILEILGNKND